MHHHPPGPWEIHPDFPVPHRKYLLRYDDAALLEESRPGNITTDPLLDQSFDFFGGMTVEDYSAYHGTRGGATHSRGTLPEDVRSINSQGTLESASEEGTVILPLLPLQSNLRFILKDCHIFAF
jgi:hypothetical protein